MRISLGRKEICAALAWMTLVLFAAEMFAQRPYPLPPSGYFSSWGGVTLDGRQCVPTARDFAAGSLRRTLPNLGQNGRASDLWNMNLPGWQKIANDGKKLPPARGCLVIWSSQLPGSGGAGHVAFCLGTVDPRTRMCRFVDSNWFRYPNGTERGAVHDVSINAHVLGWIVPN